MNIPTPTHPLTYNPDVRETELEKMRSYALRWHDSIIEPISPKAWVMKASNIASRAPTYVFTDFIHMRVWLKNDQARRRGGRMEP